jgi:hypothetical protein
MYTYYKRRGLSNDEDVYKIDHLTLGMLGTPHNPHLHSKAAEARHMLDFTRELLLEFKAQFGDQGLFLLRSVDALQAHYAILKSEARVLDQDSRVRLFDTCKTSILAYQSAGGHCIPKHHLWVLRNMQNVGTTFPNRLPNQKPP